LQEERASISIRTLRESCLRDDICPPVLSLP
jgi:hypothetical protein